MHFSNLGGQNDWGSFLPASQSLLCVKHDLQNTLKEDITSEDIFEEKTDMSPPIVVCHLVFCWHAKGILSTFVSLSSTKD